MFPETFALTETLPLRVTAQDLNRRCACVSLERPALRAALEAELGDEGMYNLIAERCPHVFAEQPVFVSREQVDAIASMIAAVEYVVALPAYRDAALAAAPEIARHSPGGARSVFFGYDFHVGDHGISLIEINTNAGGAMLNAALARAQRTCCAEAGQHFQGDDRLETRIMDMFRQEWALRYATRPLRNVAIVDDAPQDQYLYPEFLLFQKMFARHGVQAVIADPAQLRFHDGALWKDGLAIDLVYNRLTDFMLDAPSNAAIRAAYLGDAILLTPHPQAHALYADKRNLALLSSVDALTGFGVPPAIRDILLGTIPRTEPIAAGNAERLWAGRRQLFFKPAAGYGGRAAYRGDKLTKRVWQEILDGDYVAQALVVPGERVVRDDADMPLMKFDVRAYAYDGQVQSLAARLYQGQTTNFRTPGGGFAPVYTWS